MLPLWALFTLCRFCDDRFLGDHYGVIGVDFRVKTVNLDGTILKLQMWFVVPHHYLRPPNWVREAKGHAADTTSYMLVGTKCDQRTRRQTTTVDIEAALAEITIVLEADVTYIETSAKSGLNVDSVRYSWSKLAYLPTSSCFP
jgi:hypothetical protein